MNKIGIWPAMGLALLSGVLLGAPGCRSSPGSRPAEPGPGDTVVITGRVELPPLHPMMLFPRRVRGREHIHAGMNQVLDERICGYLDRQQPRHVYGLKEPAQLKLGALLRLRVVPWANTGDAAAKEGAVADDGRFHVEVPRSGAGYYLTITGNGSGGEVKLKARVLPAMLGAGRVEGVVVSLASTALTELAELAEGEGGSRSGARARPDQVLKEALGGKIEEFANRLRDTLTYGLWAAHFVKAQKTKPYYTFRACTARDRDPSCYGRGDKVPYALLSAAQLPADARRWAPDKVTRPLGEQYAAQGVRFAAYRPAGEGAAPVQPIVEEQAAGFVLVRPVGKGSGGVDLVFDQGVRAVGMTLQNGTTHADAARGFPRRPFRFILMDRYGAPIEEYRWYTNQGPGGAGFYGAASGTPIHRVRVEVRSQGPFTLGDLRWSAAYPEAVAGALGWVAGGNWRLVDGGDENLKFTHPYYRGYEEQFGDQFYDLRERPAESSRGRHWHVPYGPTETPEGSALTSPAFTLSNLDLDEDDRKGFGSWIIGVTGQTERVEMTALGADNKIYKFHTTANPLCRIGGIDFLFGDTPFPKPRLMPGCREQALSDKYVAGMDTHWGHFHFRANIDVPPQAQWENITSGPDRTERHIEYSTDNGATWRPLWWWPDQSHRGVNGVWWKNHGHGMYDTDMLEKDWNGNGRRGTDFDKDGVEDYVAPVDNNGNGVIDADPHGDDAREWDTEWYMEYVPPSKWRDVDGDSYLDSEIEGVSVRYRLRFVGPSRPRRCHTEACFGWKIDDFAINNDNPRVGYYTSFDGSYDANLR